MVKLMKLTVTVKSGAREGRVDEVDDNELKVFVKSLPVKGAANREAINILADHFNVSSSRVRILVGHTSRKKIVEVR